MAIESNKINHILLLQKKAVRLCTNAAYLANTEPLFHRLHTLPIFELHSYQITIFMHRFHSSELPVTFNGMFQLNSSIHKYPTRTSTNVHLNNPKTALAHRSIRHTGPDIWNSLPIDIRSSPTKFILKKRLKNYLLSCAAGVI